MGRRSTVKALKKFLKLARLVKVEDGENGLATAYCLATSEAIDSENERCVYSETKPEYQLWSDTIFKSTSAAGQEPSLGNIRLMHVGEIAGKVTKLVFEDEAKQVFLGSEAVDERISDMLRRGFIAGQSQGGRYRSRKCDVCSTDIPGDNNFCPTCKSNVVVKYVASITEVSYVDNPANPEARFQYVKGNLTELRKFTIPTASATDRHLVKFVRQLPAISEEQIQAAIKGEDPHLTTEQITALSLLKSKTKRVAGEDLTDSAFAYVGDPEKTETWKLPLHFSSEDKSTRHVRNALDRFGQTKGIPESEKSAVWAKIKAAAKKYGVEVSDDSEKIAHCFEAALNKSAEARGLQKGMYDVGQFAQLIQSMAYLWMDAEWEASREADGSEIPAQLQMLIDEMAEAFLDMAQEELGELTAAKAKISELEKLSTTGVPIMIDELLKAARKGMAGFCKGMCKVHKAMADQHMDAAESEKELGEAHKSKMDFHKGKMGEDGADKESQKSDHEFHKAAHKAHMDKAAMHEKMHKAHMDAHDHHDKLSTANMDDSDGAKAANADLVKIATEPAAIAPPVDIAGEIKKVTDALETKHQEQMSALTKSIADLGEKVAKAADPVESSPLKIGLALRAGQQADDKKEEVPGFLKVM